jgi:hypothetical protein
LIALIALIADRPAPTSRQGRRVRVTTTRAGLALASICLAPIAISSTGCTVRVDSRDFTAVEVKHFKVEAPPGQAGTPDLNLTTFDGAIDIRGWDRPEVRVEIEKRGSQKALLDQIEVIADQKGNQIVVEARRPSSKKYAFGMLETMSRNAKLTASVPAGSNLMLATGNGNITIERVKGRIELRTGDGAINGLDIGGDISARTDDGNVRMESIDGRCDVVTGDGAITIGGRLDLLRARTSDGALTLKIQPNSRVSETWSLQTDEGNIVMYLPDDMNADIDAETSSGSAKAESALLSKADLDRERHTLRGTLGNGGAIVRLRTSDGSIVLKRLPFKLHLPPPTEVERAR